MTPVRRLPWVILVVGMLTSPTQMSAEGTDEAKELFVETYRCVKCHGVAAEGLEATSEKMESTDLSGYSTDDVETLARFIRKEEDRGDVKHKKTFDGTDEELEAILAWLATLEPAAEAGADAE